MTKDGKKNQVPDNTPFEEALSSLEERVRKMETGSVPLEEMIRQYEEARKLALFCRNKLDSMKKKIEVLTKASAVPQWQEEESGAGNDDSGQDDFFAGTQDADGREQ